MTNEELEKYWIENGIGLPGSPERHKWVDGHAEEMKKMNKDTETWVVITQEPFFTKSLQKIGFTEEQIIYYKRNEVGIFKEKYVCIHDHRKDANFVYRDVSSGFTWNNGDKSYSIGVKLMGNPLEDWEIRSFEVGLL